MPADVILIPLVWDPGVKQGNWFTGAAPLGNKFGVYRTKHMFSAVSEAGYRLSRAPVVPRSIHVRRWFLIGRQITQW